MSKLFTNFCAGKLNPAAKNELESVFDEVILVKETDPDYAAIEVLKTRLKCCTAYELPEDIMNAFIAIIDEIFERNGETEETMMPTEILMNTKLMNKQEENNYHVQ
jgi:hypothetical protein